MKKNVVIKKDTIIRVTVNRNTGVKFITDGIRYSSSSEDLDTSINNFINRYYQNDPNISIRFRYEP